MVITVYQVWYKIYESRDSQAFGPLAFATAEERAEFCKGPNVYWYHTAEEDDFTLWRRGGAWAATAIPGPADRENVPPEITPEDRWLHEGPRDSDSLLQGESPILADRKHPGSHHPRGDRCGLPQREIYRAADGCNT